MMKSKVLIIDFLVVIIALGMGLYMSQSAALEDLKKQGSVYGIEAKSISGKTIDMTKFKGQVALVVNTASKCGFNSQYKDLESVYQKYKDRGFTVLGFPSNDFGDQELGTNKEIMEFCKVNFGVTFPLFEKNHVKGEFKQTAYKILTERSAPQFQGDPGWNFVKFLVDKEGLPRARFSTMTSPSSHSIAAEIEKLLRE